MTDTPYTPQYKVEIVLPDGAHPIAWFASLDDAEEFHELLKVEKPENSYQVAEINDCEKRTCTYYTHYLVRFDPEVNGSKMAHEQFHRAELECVMAQIDIDAWFETHKTGSCPQYLEQRAEYWERRVCA